MTSGCWCVFSAGVPSLSAPWAALRGLPPWCQPLGCSVGMGAQPLWGAWLQPAPSCP